MDRDPLVSVIIPTYNRCAILHEAIESVLQQTYKNFELIVVDDGSTDDTQRELSKYGERIRVLTQRNAGPAAAKNSGIISCRGELIAFLDSDDLWLKTKLQRQVSLLQHADISVPCCITNTRMQWRSRVVTSFDISWLSPELEEGIWVNVADVLVTRFLLFNQSAMIRRSAIDKVGYFDERLRVLEDRDLALRLSIEGPWAFVKEPLVVWRESAESCYQDVRHRQPMLKEKDITILERHSLRMTERSMNRTFQRLATELKMSRREVMAFRLSNAPSRGLAAAGRLLLAAARYRRAAFRRSPWFPRMIVRQIDVSTT